MAFYIQKARQIRGLPSLSSEGNPASIEALAEILNVETIRADQFGN